MEAVLTKKVVALQELESLATISPVIGDEREGCMLFEVPIYKEKCEPHRSIYSKAITLEPKDLECHIPQMERTVSVD